MHKTRFILLTIDTIMALFKDYCGSEDLPEDATALKLMLNPTNKKLAIEVVSDSWQGEQAPLNVSFKLKRIYGV